LRVRGVSLPERTFAGHAYRMPAPAWFQFERGQADIFDPARSGLKNISLTPSSIERRLHTTPLGPWCRLPEIRRALAQDKFAATLAPLLGLPDLLAGEDRLLPDWEMERPEAAAAARASAEAIGSAAPGLPPDVLRLRLRLRHAVLRRMDAAAVGREVFLPCPGYFGEPHLAFDLSRGLSFKAGIVRMANYWSKPETEARSLAWRADPELIRAAETRLFPLPSPGPQATERLISTAQAWIALAPLRDFEAASPLPLFPCATIYPDGYVPRGFQIRIKPETMRACGGSYLTLAAAGLSPYIAEPFAKACERHQDLLAQWAEDVTSLAILKWS
jgi:hypothetical protein